MNPDDQKQLEATIGQPLDAATIERGVFSPLPIASYLFYPSAEGYLTQQSVVATRPKECIENIYILDVCGYTVTGNDGQADFRLSQIVCGDRTYGLPVTVVATPVRTIESPGPYFLMVETAIVDGIDANGTIVDNGNVEIKVSAWQPDGTAAPNVTFNWRCQVVLPSIIL